MQFETAQIILNTNDSIYNTNITSFTWNNLNLRNALGTMYDKYDLFNLILNVVVNDVAITGYNLGDTDRLALLRVSGLPFKNITYDNTKQSSVIIGNYTYPVSGLYQQDYANISYATFDKNQELCNITIDMLRISDLKLCNPTATKVFPHLVFWFSVVGIEKDKGNLNGTRIEIK